MQLIQQLPGDKIRAIITLAADELHLMELKKQKQAAKKKNAFEKLEKLPHRAFLCGFCVLYDIVKNLL